MNHAKKIKKGDIVFGIASVLVVTLIIFIIVAYNINTSDDKTIKTASFEPKETPIIMEQKIDENMVIPVEEEVVDPNSQEGETKTKAPISNMPYYIKINNSANVVTIYTKDDDGNYTIPVKAMICSTGDYTPPVPKYPNSRYKVTGYRQRWNDLQGDVWGQYATQIVGNILFHSVPYLSDSEDTLEYWEYDKLGTSASMGCVRLKVEDARWIYYNIGAGTIVEFYESSDPGPLGKPSAPRISDNVECRNWDPTDDNPNNPWNKPKKEEKIIENTVENKEIKNEVQNVVVNEIKENIIENIEETNVETNEVISNEEIVENQEVNEVNTVNED